MDFIYWLVVILILVLIAYGVIFYLNRRQSLRIKEVKEKRQSIMAIPVADNLFTLKNMNLTGQTKRTYESWQATWQTVTNFQYPEIEAALVSAEQHTQRMNFVKAKTAIDEAESLIDDVKVDVEKINKALEQLLESAQKNRQELDDLQARYSKIRKQLLAHSFTFGPALETLEKNLSYLELDFTKYNSLTNEGDHLEAKEVLTRINEDLKVLEEAVEKIPPLNAQIKEEYEEQLEDIRQGYKRLLSEQYVLDEEEIKRRVAQAEEILAEAKASIAVADTTEARKHLDKAGREIDGIYALMEAEIEAKAFVDRHQSNLDRKMEHVMQSNRYVLLEIDRVSQSYALNANEMGRAKEFEDRLLKENEALRYYEKALEDHAVAYTEVKAQYERISGALSEIDKSQSELMGSMASLRHRERAAKDAVEEFDTELRNMQRTIEKRHLPGLPKVYLDLFFAVSNRIKELAEKLDRVKVDMDEVDQLVKMCREDIEMLHQRTEEIVDNASLTEYFIQAANRHRHDQPEIESAIAQALAYFHQDFEYTKAAETMKDALNKAEQGAARRVEESYFEEKQRRNF